MAKDIESIVLGGGCFWCMEAIFQKVKGVISVLPGYAGGILENPSYEKVCTGQTGHAEVVKVGFDSKKISMEKILEIFFLAHDSTSLNRQGNDVGTQYRSIILFSDQKQKKVVDEFIAKMQKKYGGKFCTEVKELEQFYEAEEYHQSYYLNNKDSRYCKLVIQPKLDELLDS